jgi:uncharacterized repeat protein (TIGR01451 family)
MARTTNRLGAATLALVVLLIGCATARADWTRAVFPGPANAHWPHTTVVAAGSAGDGVLVAAVGSHGIFTSSGGGSWSLAGTGPTSPVSAMASSLDGRTLYAAAFDDASLMNVPAGFWRSVDGGTNWHQRVEPLAAPAFRLAVDPRDAQVVYALGQELRRSTDGGASWATVPGPAAIDVAVDPRDGSLWIVRAGGQEVLHSVDLGGTWMPVDGGCPAPCEYLAIRLPPSAPGVIYTAGYGGTTTLSGIVARSVDGGMTFQAMLTQAAFRPATLTSTPDASSVAAVGADQIAVSHDRGSTWRTTPLAISLEIPVRSAAIDPDDPLTVALGMLRFFSIPGGSPGAPADVFVFRDTAVPAQVRVTRGIAEHTAYGVALRQDRPDTVYAASDAVGAARSGNGAQSFVAASGLAGNGLERSALTVAPDHGRPGRVYLGTFAGVWMSTDDGVTYTPTSLDHGAIDALAVAADGTVYAGAYDGGLWRSDDAGATWIEFGSNLPDRSVNAIAVTSPPANIVYVGITTGGAYYSADRGEHMFPAFLPYRWVNAIAVDPEDPNVVYAAVCNLSTGGLVLRVRLPGWQWQRAAAGPQSLCLNALVVDPADSHLVYAAAGDTGVWASSDAGDSWYQLSRGATERTQFSLAMTPDGNTLHAGGKSGVRSYRFAADLFADVTVSPGTPTVGDRVTYDVVFANAGPDDASNVVGVLTLPPGVSAAAGFATEHCSSVDGHVITCRLGAVAAGDGLELTLGLPAPQTPGTIAASATVTGSRPDPEPGDEAATASLTVAAKPVAAGQLDTAAPTSLSLAGPRGKPDPLARRFHLGRTLVLGWGAADTGSGIASYDVRVRTAGVRSSAGPYRIWQSATTRTSATYTAPLGSTVCFGLRARDGAGNVSGWTGDRCTAVPLAARQLSRHGRWTTSGTTLTARAAGATLELAAARARRLALVVNRCPGCGSLTVSFAGRRLAVVNLSAAKRARGVLIQLPPFPGERRGTVTVRVRSSGRPVTIAALGVSAR